VKNCIMIALDQSGTFPCCCKWWDGERRQLQRLRLRWLNVALPSRESVVVEGL